MKKNKMMRLASAMMVMSLMTTSVISGTFAKYVTEDGATDKARVAKWGITVQAGGNLFGTDYAANTDTVNTPDSIMAGTSTSVSSSDTDNIVAPGTKNEKGYKIAINGTPEVAYEVTAVVDANLATTDVDAVEEIYLKAGTYGVMVKADGLNAATDMSKYYERSTDGEYTVAGTFVAGTTYYELHDRVELLGTYYYPITWSVANNNIAAIDAHRLADIANSMMTNISAKDGNAEAATDFDYVLTWKWEFENGSTDTDKAMYNGADTILGNLMAGLDPASAEVVKIDGTTIKAPVAKDGTNVNDYNLNVAFGLKVTVTQVD